MAPASVSSPDWFRVGLWLHRWTGLVAAPFFLVLCLTGSVLIFHSEVDRLLGDAPPAGTSPAHPLSLAALASSATARAPGLRPQFVSLSPDTPGQALVSLAKPGATGLDKPVSTLLDRATGTPLQFTPPDATFTGILLKLHSQWFAGVPGEVAGSVLAVLILIALATGVIVHAPFVKAIAFGEVRRDRGERVRQLDLHNLIGAVVTGWAALVAMTGVALGLGSLALAFWQSTELKVMAGAAATRPAHILSIDRALQTARRALPDRDPQLAFWPGTEFSSPRHFSFFMYGRRAFNQRLFDVVLVDAETGAVTAKRPPPLYLKMLAVAEPLHFGDYGGLPLKLFWLLNVWATFFITANGAWLWWAKRRRRLPAKPLTSQLTA